MNTSKFLGKKISFTIARENLLISEHYFEKLISRKAITVFTNEDSEKYIYESDYKKLCYDDDVKNLSNKIVSDKLSMAFLNKSTNNKDAEFIYTQKIKEVLDKYKSNIYILEKMHDKYRYRIDILNEETPLVAAYILLAKAISLLNMAFLCIENKYISSLVLLRSIDEVIDVAEYFIISKNDEVGKNNLKKWFRENESPPNSLCRKVCSRYINDINKSNNSNNKGNELYDIIYNIKSKMIHPCRNFIIKSLLDYESIPFFL